MGDLLSPPGQSTYDSNTMYAGDGTWDASRNTFLLPNLVGLNFETMQYNGMGNRFRDLPQYHTLIKGHGIVATITFLFIVPAAILVARFYGRSPMWALKLHIYLQILTVALSTVVFILGFMAVGLPRSLTNPHHGIGVAIYVLIMVQAMGGGWINKREKGKARRKLPVKLVLHQWFGRAIALLGFAQVPLGLTLYGSPKWTFILYALWMFFLLVLYFILSYRAMGPIGGDYSHTVTSVSHGGTVIEDKKKSRFGLLAPLAAGAGLAALLGRKRDRSRSRSRERRDEVIGSRRDSGSFIEEKYERKEESGIMGKLFKGAAVVGAGALAKNWWDKRQQRKDDGSEYSSVAHDTPSRKHGRHGRHHGSVYSDESVSVHRMEEGRPSGAILPGPGNPLAAATAISAAERPVTPRPAHRRDSVDSDSYYTSVYSPSRRPQSSHAVRNGVLATIGLGWFAKKMKDRRDRKELDRLDREEAERVERERLARHGGTPSRLTGDGFAPPRRQRRDSRTDSSDLSSIVVEDPHRIRPGGVPIPPIPVSYGDGPIRSHTETVTTMPPAPVDPQGILHQGSIESGSENYMSAGGHPHRRHSARRRREGEAAAAAATAAAATLAAEEERRRRRSRSRSQNPDVVSPPVSVKVKMHGDRDRNVTLRRLTEEEAALEREARKGDRRRRRADSLSSLSGTDTAASRRRYRRGDRDGSESRVSAAPPPPAMAPLSPPNPAFAAGRRPKDSAYYSGRPGESSAPIVGPGSVSSPGSHGTWSAVSPVGGSVSDGIDPAERRRRRRLERNRRDGTSGTGTVDFT